jgi:nitrile hydratase
LVWQALPRATYDAWGYYGKWAASALAIGIERGVFNPADLDVALGYTAKDSDPSFVAGDFVRVRTEDAASRFRRPHLRTPGYVFGAVGLIERYAGTFGDPEFLAFRGVPRKEPLYRVRFPQSALWHEYRGSESDTIEVEIYQSWLLTATREQWDVQQREAAQNHIEHAHHHDDAHAGHHDDDHGHGHSHEARETVELTAIQSEGPESIAQRVGEALFSLLIKTNRVTPEEVTLAIEKIDSMGSSNFGPRLVARAWADEAFKVRLLSDAAAAAAELGIQASNSTANTKLTAVANTESVHNVVVCTLCSCYPLSILGLSPPWYKDRRYRARVVRDPRAVLKEFGTHIPTDVAVRVHDSTADLRYIVIPMRPDGTDGWGEVQLQRLVSRDSMIGVRFATPAASVDLSD